MTSQPHGRTYEFALPDRLRAAREQAGFGQKDFEESTGISRASISNYERGITKPRRPQLAAWALATGFDIEWLETGKPPSPQGPGGEMLSNERTRGDSNAQPSDLSFVADSEGGTQSLIRHLVAA